MQRNEGRFNNATINGGCIATTTIFQKRNKVETEEKKHAQRNVQHELHTSSRSRGSSLVYSSTFGISTIGNINALDCY